MKALADRGHNLKILSTRLFDYKNENVTQIHLNIDFGENCFNKYPLKFKNANYVLDQFVNQVILIQNIAEVFRKTFESLEYRVLWKYEGKFVESTNQNLMVEKCKWFDFPQEDIIAHPNVKVFINHGGFLSLQESIARVLSYFTKIKSIQKSHTTTHISQKPDLLRRATKSLNIIILA
jgi:hypothetical protein